MCRTTLGTTTVFLLNPTKLFTVQGAYQGWLFCVEGRQIYKRTLALGCFALPKTIN
jgi:hypothetical protein